MVFWSYCIIFSTSICQSDGQKATKSFYVRAKAYVVTVIEGFGPLMSRSADRISKKAKEEWLGDHNHSPVRNNPIPIA